MCTFIVTEDRYLADVYHIDPYFLCSASPHMPHMPHMSHKPHIADLSNVRTENYLRARATTWKYALNETKRADVIWTTEQSHKIQKYRYKTHLHMRNSMPPPFEFIQSFILACRGTVQFSLVFLRIWARMLPMKSNHWTDSQLPHTRRINAKRSRSPLPSPEPLAGVYRKRQPIGWASLKFYRSAAIQMHNIE